MNVLKKVFAGVVLASLIGCQQTASFEGGLTEHTVVSMPGASKNELYVTSNNWLVDQFHDADSVIDFTDKEAGTMSGRYFMGWVWRPHKDNPAGVKSMAVIRVWVKDGAAKMEITPSSFPYNGYSLIKPEDAQAKALAMLENFRNTLANTSSGF